MKHRSADRTGIFVLVRPLQIRKFGDFIPRAGPVLVKLFAPRLHGIRMHDESDDRTVFEGFSPCWTVRLRIYAQYSQYAALSRMNRKLKFKKKKSALFFHRCSVTFNYTEFRIKLSNRDRLPTAELKTILLLLLYRLQFPMSSLRNNVTGPENVRLTLSKTGRTK